MSFLPRALKIAAGTLLLLMLLGVSCWYTRHQWIPPLASQLLDGIELRQINDLSIFRTVKGFGVSVREVELTTHSQMTISVNDLRLDHLTALFLSGAPENGNTENLAELTLGKVEIASGTKPFTDSGKQAPSTGTTDSSIGNQSSTPASANGDTNNKVSAGFSISSALETLRGLPLEKLVVRQFLWQEHLDTPLSLTAQLRPETSIQETAIEKSSARNSRQLITAEITSSRCNQCQISLTLVNRIAQANAHLQIFHEKVTVTEITAQLRQQESLSATGSQAPWATEAKLEIAASPLISMLKDIGLSINFATLSADQNLSGELNARLLSEIPDKVATLSDIHHITLELDSNALNLELPEQFGAPPVTVSVESLHPLSAKIPTLAPFQVESLEGSFTLQVFKKADQPSDQAATPAMLKAEFSLETERKIPQVTFHGEYNLAQASELFRSPKWQKVLTPYQVDQVSGIHTVSGHFALPRVEDISNEARSSLINDFSAEIHITDNTEFTVTLPETNNPLSAIQWQKVRSRLTARQPIQVSAPELPGNLQLKVPDLHIEADAAPDSNSPFSNKSVLSSQLQALHCTELPSINCQLQLKVKLPALAVKNPAVSLDELSAEMTLALAQNPSSGVTSLSFQPLNIAARQAKSGDVTIDTPELFTSKGACIAGPDTLRCSSPQLALSLAPLTLIDNQISGVLFLENLVLEKQFQKAPKSKKGVSQPFMATADFHSDALNVTALKQYKTAFSSKGQLQLKDNYLSGSGRIISDPLNLETAWEHNLDNGHGSSQLDLRQTTFSPQSPLSHALQGLPLDIVEGTLSATAKVHWPQNDQDQLHLSMEDAAIQYGDTVAVGIDLSSTFSQQSGNWVTPAPAPVSIRKIDAGVAIKNLHFSLSASESGNLNLGDFSAELLDGVLTSNKLTWNIKGQERQSELQFTGISIGTLAKEMESQSFAASGLLDATIPITTDAQGITVENGSLQSRAPGGRLRYYGAFSPSMLGTNPQLKLLAGALEDYNYQDIHGTITYPLSGDLKLNLKLTGRSEAIDANRDLIINLNLENNVPTMLRSLQASRDLTDVLEQQVQ